MQITWDEWVEQYKPKVNHILGEEGASFCGYMYETFGEEFDYVRTVDPSLVWTIMDGDDGETFVGDGLHFVNRIGYIVTEVPAPDGFVEVMVDW